MVTSTPGKTAPLGSFTEPLTEAVVCADRTAQLNTKISNPVSAFLHTRSKKCFVLSLRSFRPFIFPSTLMRKNVTLFRTRLWSAAKLCLLKFKTRRHDNKRVSECQMIYHPNVGIGGSSKPLVSHRLHVRQTSTKLPSERAIMPRITPILPNPECCHELAKRKRSFVCGSDHQNHAQCGASGCCDV